MRPQRLSCAARRPPLPTAQSCSILPTTKIAIERHGASPTLPIIDIHDAKDVDDALQGILDAPVHERARRRLFIETLDFNVADILISLRGAACRKLPYAAISALPSSSSNSAPAGAVMTLCDTTSAPKPSRSLKRSHIGLRPAGQTIRGGPSLG